MKRRKRPSSSGGIWFPICRPFLWEKSNSPPTHIHTGAPFISFSAQKQHTCTVVVVVSQFIYIIRFLFSFLPPPPCQLAVVPLSRLIPIGHDDTRHDNPIHHKSRLASFEISNAVFTGPSQKRADRVTITSSVERENPRSLSSRMMQHKYTEEGRPSWKKRPTFAFVLHIFCWAIRQLSSLHW
jgi:hypothetical protein